MDLIHQIKTKGGQKMDDKLMELIDDKRIKKRMTVEEFCKQIDVDVSTFYKWKAEPNRMKLSTLRKIADVLNFTIAEKKQIL